MRIPKGKLGAASLLAVLTVTSAYLFVAGLPVEKASATCYDRITVCHGLPFQGCIGWEKSKERPVPEEMCGKVTEIERRCNNVAERLCEAGNGSIDNSWADKSEVYGLKCSTWQREYTLELRSC